MADIMQVAFHLTCGPGGYQFRLFLNTADYDLALAKAGLLAPKYMACLGQNVSMPLIVASNIDIPGDSVILTNVAQTPQIVFPDLGKTPTVPIAVNQPADLWWTAALLRLGSTASKRGQQFMRLIPDSVTVGLDYPLDDPVWVGAVQAYFTALQVNGWGIMALDRSNTNRTAIQAITVNNTTLDVTIKTAAIHTITEGKPFHLGQFGPQSAKVSPNGNWIADSVPNNTTIIVRSPQNMTVPSTFKTLGKVWPTTRTYAAIQTNNCKIVKCVTRKAGKPVNTLKGRNKRR